MNSQTWFNGAMHRLGLFIVAPALLLASCAVGVPSDANDVRFTPERPLQIDWVRTVAGYEISGSGRQIDLGELSLLQEAFELMPAPVLELAQPDALFRIPRGEQVSSLTRGSVPKTLVDPAFLVPDPSFTWVSATILSLIGVGTGAANP